MTIERLEGVRSSSCPDLLACQKPWFSDLEYFCVCSLHLAIAPRVGLRGEAQLDAHFFAETEKGLTRELGAVVGDDPVGHSKSEHDPLDELDGGLSRLLWYWHHFYPLAELVDGDEEVLMSSDRPWYLSHNVQPPDRERPGDWNWL